MREIVGYRYRGFRLDLLDRVYGSRVSTWSVSRIFTRGAAGEFSKSARSRLCDFRSGFMASIEIYLPSFESTCDREI